MAVIAECRTSSRFYLGPYQKTSGVSTVSHPSFTDKKIRMFQSEITHEGNEIT